MSSASSASSAASATGQASGSSGQGGSGQGGAGAGGSGQGGAGAGGDAPGTCASPVPLAFDASKQATASGTLEGAAASESGSCPSAAPELVYSFSTSEPQNFVASVMGSPSFKPALYLRSGSCASGAELSCKLGGQGSAALTATALAPGSYFLFVDGEAAADAGPFLLSAALTDPFGDGNSCAGPAPIELSNGGFGTGSVSGTFEGATKDGQCSGSADRVYTFTITGTRTVEHKIKSDGQLYKHIASTPGDCGDPPPVGCSGPSLAGGGLGGSSGPHTGPKTFWIWISYAGGAKTFSIDLNVQ